MNTLPLYRRWETNVCIGVVLAFGMAGCVSISKPALTKQTFIFDVSSEPSTAKSATDRVLGIRKLQIATPFEGRSLVYRTGESMYVRDPYAEFLDWPADQMIASIRTRFRSSHVFASVVEPGSEVKPDTLLEINVIQFYGDFRQKDHPIAVLTIRFIFLNAHNGIADKVLFQKEYSRNLPLKENSADALMAKWNQELSEIVAEVAAEFSTTVVR